MLSVSYFYALCLFNSINSLILKDHLVTSLGQGVTHFKITGFVTAIGYPEICKGTNKVV